MTNMGFASEEDKIRAVDRWLDDVSAAAKRKHTAESARLASERTVAHLEEAKSRVHGTPGELEGMLDEAIRANRENIELQAESALRYAELVGGFNAVLEYVSPPEVAEAWRMRCIDGKTWLQCSLALHYNRQHLERLSRRAKAAAYPHIPVEYRR